MANPTASLAMLPIELQELIVSHIASPKTLASLNQTSRTFRRLTEKSLFGSVLIHGGKMNAFSAALKQNPKRKDSIYELDIDYGFPGVTGYPPEHFIYSACTFMPLFVQFSNLRSLRLVSGFFDNYTNGQSGVDELINDEELVDRLPVDWETDQARLDEAFKRASVLAPPEERIWKHLRSLYIEIWEERYDKNDAWISHSSAMFLIEQLHELTIKGRAFRGDDGEELIDSPYRGTTQLRKLNLEECAIHHVALHRFLSMPQALTHLTLEQSNLCEGHGRSNGAAYEMGFDHWDWAFEPQSKNLELMHLEDGPWTAEHVLETIDRYPSLRVVEMVQTQDEEQDDIAEELAKARAHGCEVTIFKRRKSLLGYYAER